MISSNCERVVRTTPRGRNKFSYWPVCVASVVVLTFRTPRKGITVVPLRGGDRREDLPFERKTPGDVRIAPIADPLDTEVDNRNEGTLDVLKVISTAPTSL